MSEVVVLAFFATVQALCTAILYVQINRNACGGAKCVQTMSAVLGIKPTLARDIKAAESATLDVFESSEAANGYPK